MAISCTEWTCFQQIGVAFGGCSAVDTLAWLPGTAVLNFLVDHAVFGNQPLPGQFAAVSSAKRCTVGLIKPCKTDYTAVHRAVSPVRVPVRVPPRWTVTFPVMYVRFG